MKTKMFFLSWMVCFSLTLASLNVQASTAGESQQQAQAQWEQIHKEQTSSNQIEEREKFFEHWASHEPRALVKMARRFFNETIATKQVRKREYLEQLQLEWDQKGSFISRQIESMAQSGMTFKDFQSVVSQGTVESVLTAHPTQIHSRRFRILWQLQGRLEEVLKFSQRNDLIHANERMRMVNRLMVDFGWTPEDVDSKALTEWSEKKIQEVRQKILVIEAGSPRRSTVEEETQDTMDLYLGNIYWAILKLRSDFISSVEKSFGGQADFDLSEVKKMAEKMVLLSTWSWDADGKAMVNAKSMSASGAIQQSAIYRLHSDQLQGILKTAQGKALEDDAVKNVLSRLEELHQAIVDHRDAVKQDLWSTAVLMNYPQFQDPKMKDMSSPSGQVRQLFSSWVISILEDLEASHSALGNELKTSLEELLFAIHSFQINNHVRQNSVIIEKALSPLFSGNPSESIALLQNLQNKSAEGSSLSQALISNNVSLKTEIERLQVLAKDPGESGTYISADTATVEDTDRVLFLLEFAGLTGKVRYFPLLENPATFRKLPKLVQSWLKPGALMRKHVLRRSALSQEPPTLYVMFALSDTNRVGSQAANHLMEMQAEALQAEVDALSVQYPITREETEAFGVKSSPFSVRIFWGGGNQIARGGDWLSDEKGIITDQGNAKDLKYDSPEMALQRMERHLTQGMRQAQERLFQNKGQVQNELARLQSLILKRETNYYEIFFSNTTGHRSAWEAYLQFGSMLTETRSNSYGARGVNRVEDHGLSSGIIHRLADRLFVHEKGQSFDQIVDEMGINSVLQMKLKDLWQRMRPGISYSPPSIEQRTITVDNSLSETKIHQLAMSVEAEEALGITPEESARLMNLNGAPFRSYARQKAAEILATSTVNQDTHLARLPKALRKLVGEKSSVEHFLTVTRGKSADELTVLDLVATFSWIHFTLNRVSARNAMVVQAFSSEAFNPLQRAMNFCNSENFLTHKPRELFGQSLLAWIHKQTIFGTKEKSPAGLAELFPELYLAKSEGEESESDLLGQLEFLAWALHYEAQQFPMEVNEIISVD